MLPLALLAATSVAFPVYEPPAAIALSGERVLWTATSPRGDVIVREAPVSGGRPRVVARVVTKSGLPTSVSLAANASGFVVAVREPRAEHVEAHLGGVRRSLVDCATRESRYDDLSLTVVGGRSGFVFAGARCGSAPVELIGADGSRAPVPDLRVYLDYSLAYSEPFLAVTAGIEPPAQYVRVLDLSTGAERPVQGYSDRGGDIALLADGTLITDTPWGIYAWRPSEPLPTLLTRAEGPFAATDAGVVFIAGSRARFVPAGGGPAKRLRATSSAVGPLAFDGRRAAFTHVTCGGRLRVAVVDVRLPPRRPACPPRGIAG